MNALLFLFFCIFFPFSVQALPRCDAEVVGAAFLGSWRKIEGVWEMNFTCPVGEKGKILIETIDNIQSVEGIFYVTDANGNSEGEDFYNDACEAVRDYCSTSTTEEAEPEDMTDGGEEEDSFEAPPLATEEEEF